MSQQGPPHAEHWAVSARWPHHSDNSTVNTQLQAHPETLEPSIGKKQVKIMSHEVLSKEEFILKSSSVLAPGWS